jgi:hypothetical protein
MTAITETGSRPGFLAELREQRHDDHRYYHQSRVNQSLHLFSSCCFVATYVLIPINPIAAALLGWVVAMWSRQIGHFFFEPREYDEVNGASFAYKEAVKVGFNLRRKVILFVSWLSVPAALALSPSFFGMMTPWADRPSYLHHLGVLWLGLAAVGLFGRAIFLCLTRNVQTGLVWFTKILTDPFHDIMIYYKAPFYLFKGQLYDPALRPELQRPSRP